jgi:hypothetical protein
MGAQDDFGLWERELDESGEPSGDRAALVATAAVATCCVLLIALGQVPLGIAGLIVSGLILALWRYGL